MELQSLPPVDLHQSDEELGWWLISTWIGHRAQREGFALNAIPPEWAEQLIKETAKVDSDSITSAPLESIFRKACAGNMETAGRMLRSYMWSGAETMVSEKYADAGIKLARGRMKAGEKTAKAKQSDAASWHAKCAEKARALLQQGKAPRELAGVLAPIFGVTPQTIRSVLKKANLR